MSGYWGIVTKEVRHLLRDPASLVIALMLPIIQLTIFGFAVNFDIRNIATSVVDFDRSRESRAYISQLENTQYLEVVRHDSTLESAEDALRSGKVRVVVVIPPDFAQRFGTSRAPEIQALVDGSDSQVANRARIAFAPGPAQAGPSHVDARVTVKFNPALRTENFVIPGLIAVILQIVTVSLTAFSLVREKEQGTLEQLMVTPVGRLGLMLGKLTPYAVLAMAEMLLVVTLGWIVFDVPVAGSVPLLVILAIPFIVAALALGLMISTIAQSQGQALQITMLITLPSILMSGFVFPRETMPGVLYVMSSALPVTHFLNVLRGIYLRDAGFAQLAGSVGALVLIAVLLITVSARRFQKSVD